jgi:Na+/H+-translocating membrane pyrophosphatase
MIEPRIQTKLGIASAVSYYLTFALIGVDATMADSIYEQVVGLGALGATAIAVVLRIVAGIFTKIMRQE